MEDLGPPLESAEPDQTTTNAAAGHQQGLMPNMGGSEGTQAQSGQGQQDQQQQGPPQDQQHYNPEQQGQYPAQPQEQQQPSNYDFMPPPMQQQPAPFSPQQQQPMQQGGEMDNNMYPAQEQQAMQPQPQMGNGQTPLSPQPPNMMPPPPPQQPGGGAVQQGSAPPHSPIQPGGQVNNDSAASGGGPAPSPATVGTSTAPASAPADSAKAGESQGGKQGEDENFEMMPASKLREHCKRRGLAIRGARDHLIKRLRSNPNVVPQPLPPGGDESKKGKRGQNPLGGPRKNPAVATAPVPPPPPPMQDGKPLPLGVMTVEQLRNECKRRALAVRGSKAEILHRLGASPNTVRAAQVHHHNPPPYMMYNMMPPPQMQQPQPAVPMPGPYMTYAPPQPAGGQKVKRKRGRPKGSLGKKKKGLLGPNAAAVAAIEAAAAGGGHPLLPPGTQLPDMRFMSVTDMRTECKRRGLPIRGTKDEIRTRLFQHSQAALPPNASSVVPQTPLSPPKAPFQHMPLAKLREECTKRGFSGDGTKAQLVGRLMVTVPKVPVQRTTKKRKNVAPAPAPIGTLAAYEVPKMNMPHMAAAAHGSWNPVGTNNALPAMSIKELREEARRLGASSAGKKAELVERVKMARHDAAARAAQYAGVVPPGAMPMPHMAAMARQPPVPPPQMQMPMPMQPPVPPQPVVYLSKFGNMTQTQLRDECRRLGLAVWGTKDDIIRRLTHADQKTANGAVPPQPQPQAQAGPPFATTPPMPMAYPNPVLSPQPANNPGSNQAPQDAAATGGNILDRYASVTELRDECKKQGLAVRGTKAEIVERLRANANNRAAAGLPPSPGGQPSPGGSFPAQQQHPQGPNNGQAVASPMPPPPPQAPTASAGVPAPLPQAMGYGGGGHPPAPMSPPAAAPGATFQNQAPAQNLLELPQKKLQEECNKRGLIIRGTKAELVARINQHDGNNAARSPLPAASPVVAQGHPSPQQQQHAQSPAQPPSSPYNTRHQQQAQSQAQQPSSPYNTRHQQQTQSHAQQPSSPYNTRFGGGGSGGNAGLSEAGASSIPRPAGAAGGGLGGRDESIAFQLSGEELSSMSINDLRTQCKKRGLSAGGSKQDMIQRLNEVGARQVSVSDIPVSFSDICEPDVLGV